MHDTTHTRHRWIATRAVVGLLVALATVLTPSWAAAAGDIGGIHGRVSGPDGPLAGISVSVRPTSGYTTTVTTAADGSYSFTGLAAPQSYELGFFDPGGTWAYERYDDAFGYEPSTKIALTAGSDVGPLDASLGETGSISGTVFAGGAVAADSSVELYQLDGAQWRFAGNTHTYWTAGRYTFDDLAPGTYRVGVDRPDEPYVDTFYPSADLVQNGEDVVVRHGEAVTSADIALLPGGAIGGTVSDDDGKPLAGVTVRATDTDAETRYFTAVTDAQGRYRIGQLTTADYRVFFSAYGTGKQSEYWADAPTRYTSTPLHVVSGRDSSGTDARLSAPSRLHGTVVDATTGDPIPYAYVKLYEKQGDYWQGVGTESTYADEQGRYELPGTWGTYRVLAADSAWGTHGYAFHPAAESPEAATTVVVAPGAEPVADVAIPRNADTSTIAGQVTSGRTGRGGIEVVAEQLTDDGRWSTTYSTTTRTDGGYRVFAAQPGTYRLRFRDPTGVLPDHWWDAKASAADATPIVITQPGSAVARVDMDLGAIPSTGRITGAVTGPSGTSAPDIDVTVYERDVTTQVWTSVRTTTTDNSGSYVVANLPVGAYRVGFEDDSGLLDGEFHPDSPTVQGASDVQVGTGTDTVVDARLAPGPGGLGGSVSRTGSIDVEGLRVVAYASTGDTWNAVAETTPAVGGQWEIPDLPPGTYRLGFLDDGTTHVSEYWRDTATLAAAADVVVRTGPTDFGYSAQLGRVGASEYAPLTRPAIVGTARVGELLRADPGTWTPENYWHSYQWLADGVALDGAVHQHLTVTPALVGGRLSVRITTWGYTANPGQAVSDQTAPVESATTPTPTPTPTPNTHADRPRGRPHGAGSGRGLTARGGGRPADRDGPAEGRQNGGGGAPDLPPADQHRLPLPVVRTRHPHPEGHGSEHQGHAGDAGQATEGADHAPGRRCA